jgi:3-phosphoshikimate 1-carboxyvinyltransferase
VRLQTSSCFRGRFRLPGDKSLSHRLALLGAIARGETLIHNFSTAADCQSTLSCLGALGVSVERRGTSVLIRGNGPDGLAPPQGPLDAGNSGSTLRMLAGILAGRPFRSVLTGDASLQGRPVERVAEPLRAMGASLASRNGHPPLEIHGGPLRGIDWTLPVPSAQVKTALLLAGLHATGRTTVREPARSRDHTETLLPLFGAEVIRGTGRVSVDGGAALQGASYTVPGDASSAAFLIVAALVLKGSRVRIDDVLLSPGRTAFLEVLRRMGGRIEVGVEAADPEPRGFILAFSSELVGTEVPPGLVPSLIDELPALAVAASHARGTFAVSGASELRVKESDRIAAICAELSRLGVGISERPDGFRIEGGAPLRGTTVRSHGDHRIAMSLAVAGLSAEGETLLEGDECIPVSFPEFPGLLSRATSPRDRVVLVGFMGAGKSTVGPLLARLLGWELVEMDQRIEAEAGMSVPELFARHGEAAFRDRELQAARALQEVRRAVVATGGGAFAEPRTRDALAEGSVTVFLQAPFETLLERIRGGAGRPLAGDRETMEQLLAERDPSYRQADLVVETAGATPQEVAGRIAEELRGLRLRREG